MSQKIVRLVMGTLVALSFGMPTQSFAHPTDSLTIVQQPGGVVDSGTITIAFNGHWQSVPYGQFSTPSSIASAFAAEFSSYPASAWPRLCAVGVCAKASGATITFQLSGTGPFTSPVITGSTASFTVNTSAWTTTAPLSIVTSSLPTGAQGVTYSASLQASGGQPPYTWSYTGSLPSGLQSGASGAITGTPTGPGTSTITVQVTDATQATASGSLSIAILGGSTTQSTIYSYAVAAGGYDLNGNVLGYTDSVMGAWTFGYDQLNRLTMASNPAMPPVSTPNVPAPSWEPYFCWAYDAFGNRLSQNTSGAAFVSGDGTCATSGTLYENSWATYSAQNQITGTNAPNVTPYAPAYDAAGDVSADINNIYLYDAEGRICAATTLTGNIGYLYDAAGHRVAKGTITSWSCDITQNGFQRTAGFVVDGDGQQLTEVDAGNNWKHTNVWANGKQIGTLDGNVSAPTLHFYFDDPLGTRRAQANSSGTLEAVYQSLPFGDGYAMGGTVNDPTENHFTGKERDTESGNDYMFARYYNSATGRFLSPDWSAKVEPVPYAKLGDPQSLNLYSYVENNPLNRTDPTGHCGENAQAKPCKVKDIKMKATPSNPNMVQQDMDGKGGVGKVTGVRATITESIKVSGNPQVSVSEQNTTQNTRNGVIQPNQQQVQNTNSVTLQPGQQITDASSLVRATGGDPQVSQAIAQDYTNNAWTSSTNHSETLTLGNGQEFLAVTQRTLQNGAGGPTYTQSTTQPAVLSLGTPTPVEPIPTTYTGDIQ